MVWFLLLLGSKKCGDGPESEIMSVSRKIKTADKTHWNIL